MQLHQQVGEERRQVQRDDGTARASAPADAADSGGAPAALGMTKYQPSRTGPRGCEHGWRRVALSDDRRLHECLPLTV